VEKAEVVPHNPNWGNEFEKEAKQVAAAMGETLVAVHHIGSTAIDGIYAKPVIDMLVEVRQIADVDERNSAMERLGYQVKGEFGIPGRRYFRKDNQAGTRTHQIHIFESGSEQVRRHLAFRDFLNDHPAEAQQYSELKRKLAAEYPNNMNGYIAGKESFIKEIDRKAAKWLALQTD
jgi:GrpB-like predicted nucleotidyltransferase (UPF0157 family)